MILILAAAAIVISCLFPPWMFTFHRLATGEDSGWQSERSAGYSLIFWPPNPNFSANGGSDVVEVRDSNLMRVVFLASFGIRLDTSRLIVEWFCILVVAGSAWFCTQPNRMAAEASQPPAEVVEPF